MIKTVAKFPTVLAYAYYDARVKALSRLIIRRPIDWSGIGWTLHGMLLPGRLARKVSYCAMQPRSTRRPDLT